MNVKENGFMATDVITTQDGEGGADAATTSGRYGQVRAALLARVPCLTGLTLLCSAVLKVWQMIQSPVLPPPPMGVPDFDFVLIGMEMFLGLWLLSGALAGSARLAAILCFIVFGSYAFYEALSGKADCGCFGQVKVNPWFTAMSDVAIVLALVLLAKPAAKSTTPASRWTSRKWPVVVALGLGLAAGIASATLHPRLAVAANGLSTADSGKFVILEPHKWIGHRLPVLGHIVARHGGANFAGKLGHGLWIVLFYHANCGECQKTIPVYERFAQRQVAHKAATGVAFVRVPSDFEAAVPKKSFDSDVALQGTLDSSRHWFVTTPAAMELNNGIVIRAIHEAAAMNLRWLK
jgi:hypothetical protein